MFAFIKRSPAILFATLGCLLPAMVSAEIIIGVAGPLSGNVALNGEQQDIGAQRAISDLNDNGGVLGKSLEVISVDDACDVDQAVAAAKRLVAAKVSVVIGHLCSRTSIAASEIYNAAGILMISPASTNPTVTERGLPFVFRTIGRDDDQAAVAAKFIMSDFADAEIALLHDGNTYGKGLVEGVKKELNAAGKTEVVFEEFQGEQASYAELIASVISAGAKVVYMVSNGVNDAALITRQLEEANPDAILISADSMAGDGFSLIAGDAAEGTYFTFGPDARLDPVAADVVASFRDEEAYEPEGYTLYSYAAVQAWAQAVEAAGAAESVKVAEKLRSSTFNSVIGSIGFNEKGDVTGVDNFVMYIWGANGYAPVQ